MEELANYVTVLAFMGGFMSIIVGVNYAIRWTNRRLEGDQQSPEGVEHMAERIAELEERLDVTERVVADLRSREKLPPGSSTS